MGSTSSSTMIWRTGSASTSLSPRVSLTARASTSLTHVPSARSPATRGSSRSSGAYPWSGAGRCDFASSSPNRPRRRPSPGRRAPTTRA
eukprot:3381201-Pyramimonas_sp.AAC.1